MAILGGKPLACYGVFTYGVITPCVSLATANNVKYAGLITATFAGGHEGRQEHDAKDNKYEVDPISYRR
jgi:hypothetical protein